MPVVLLFPSRPILRAEQFVQQPDRMVLADRLVQRRVKEHRLLPIQARFRPIIHESLPLNAAVRRLSPSMETTINEELKMRTLQTSGAVD